MITRPQNQRLPDHVYERAFEVVKSNLAHRINLQGRNEDLAFAAFCNAGNWHSFYEGTFTLFDTFGGQGITRRQAGLFWQAGALLEQGKAGAA